jgi:8-oxo-dGTP pyrophosphatase MutT (NUDIX family)
MREAYSMRGGFGEPARQSGPLGYAGGVSTPVFHLDTTLRATIARHLAAHARHEVLEPGLVRAAVACVLLPTEAGEAGFALTRRTRKLRRHGGQFALPGGRLEPGESAEEAALRELHEELGLLLPQSAVLGCMDDFATRSGFVMTPVVVWAADARELVPDPDEVARAYRLALHTLFHPSAPILTPTADPARPILSMPLADTQVYSPTAAILYQLRELALCGRSTPVHHYEQPLFAWR